jgi:hypothetical protein
MSDSEELIELDVSGALFEGLEDLEAGALFGGISVSTVICNKCEI